MNCYLLWLIWLLWLVVAVGRWTGFRKDRLRKSCLFGKLRDEVNTEEGKEGALGLVTVEENVT